MFQALRRLGPDCPNPGPHRGRAHARSQIQQPGRPGGRGAARAGGGADPKPAPARVAATAHGLVAAPPAFEAITATAPHVLARILPLQHIDAYFTMARNPAPIRSTPSVVWIPDFQHRRLPDNFTPEERAVRDRDYQTPIGWATLMAATADDVGRDLATFAPEHASKARQLRCVAPVPAEAHPGRIRGTRWRGTICQRSLSICPISSGSTKTMRWP